MDNQWSESTILLLKKWERICHYRKSAHYKSSNTFGWKNKLLSIPIIIISTILGSLSFIHPSFMEQTPPRRLLNRNLQTLPCECEIYRNDASSLNDDLCMKLETNECYPPNPEDYLCPGDMLSCTNINVPTESPSFNDCPAGGFCAVCGTCSPGRCNDNSCPLFDGKCTCADDSCPSNVGSDICSEESSESDCVQDDCHIIEDSDHCESGQSMVAICDDGDWNDECISNWNIPEDCSGKTT